MNYYQIVLTLVGDRLNELKEASLKISVNYKDSEKKKHPDCFYLDFGELINSRYDRSPLDDISRTLKNDIASTLKKLRI